MSETFSLRAISTAAVPRALERAERYRLLNDPELAESICLDILEIDPENQSALVTLLLAITDQFGEDLPDGPGRAQAVLPRLRDEYKRAYYAGIILERRAKARLRRSGPGAQDIASEWFHDARAWYERAEALRPPGNDEAILRWNTCVRMLGKHERVSHPLAYEPVLDD